MPNHVTNILTINGTENEIKAVLTVLLDKDGNVDFNGALPIPEELKGTSSPVSIISQKEYMEQEEKIARGETVFKRGVTQKISQELIEKFGYDNWYDWQINAWGTKWNAYSQGRLDDVTFQFDTAWSTPSNFIDGISKLFPNVTFMVKYADEDMGYNVGEYHVRNDEYIYTNQPQGGSIEAYRMALELQGGTDSWMLNDLFHDLDESEIENAINGDESFESMAVNLAYEFEKSNEDYPEVLKQHLLDRAVEDENYMYASKLRDSM